MGHRTPRRGMRRSLLYLFVALTVVAVATPLGDQVFTRLAHASIAPAPLAAPRPASNPEVAEDHHSGSFSLLTYNVAGLPDWISPVEPEENMPRIAERLNGYDLVLVQEDFSHHAALERGARHRYHSVAQARANSLVNDGLNRFSRFDFVPLTRQRWRQCHGVFAHANDCLGAKGFSMAETTLAPGARLHVYNHHADAGSAKGDRAARAAQFDQLAEFILEHSRGQAVLLVGDTNLSPTSPADARILARFLERTGLVDACDAQLCETPQVDRVLYRSSERLSLEPDQWELAAEFGTDPPALSDHRAVHVRMRWQSRSSERLENALYVSPR